MESAQQDQCVAEDAQSFILSARFAAAAGLSVALISIAAALPIGLIAYSLSLQVRNDVLAITLAVASTKQAPLSVQFLGAEAVNRRNAIVAHARPILDRMQREMAASLADANNCIALHTRSPTLSRMTWILNDGCNAMASMNGRDEVFESGSSYAGEYSDLATFDKSAEALASTVKVTLALTKTADDRRLFQEAYQKALNYLIVENWPAYAQSTMSDLALQLAAHEVPGAIMSSTNHEHRSGASNPAGRT